MNNTRTRPQRMSPTRRPPWLAKLSGALRANVERLVDADVEFAVAIFRQLNLARFTTERSFRRYTAVRRERARAERAAMWAREQATRQGGER